MIPKFSVATPGALMMIAGALMMFWAIREWNLFGLGEGVAHGD